MSEYHGKFVWYELITPDPAAAAAFYHDVIGWEARDAGLDGMAYTLFYAAGNHVAGMLAAPEGSHHGWLGYLDVDDIDVSSRQISDAGGKIHRPTSEISGIGKFAVVADPQGAAFVLFQRQITDPPHDSLEPGHIGWHELYALDNDAALAFYGKMFGWAGAGDFDMGPMGKYLMFSTGGHALGGMLNKPATVPVTAWLYYFNVPSASAAVSKIEGAGGKVVHGPQEVPGGTWIVHGIDPQGIVFALSAPHR